MALNFSEIEGNLRKYEFPLSVTKALTKIGEICSAGMRAQLDELIIKIASEFVFLEVDRHNTRKQKLSSVQELQLLDVLSNYFRNSMMNETAIDHSLRNQVFQSIFTPASDDRLRVLVKLVSMAISTTNVSVLVFTGEWMQNHGSDSSAVLGLTDGLVKDYFVLVPKALDGLQELPNYAKQFTANFITAVANIFGLVDNHTFNPIPDALLDVITKWTDRDLSLCVAGIKAKYQNYVLNVNARPTVAPYEGLLKWCILSPLYDYNMPEKEYRWSLFSDLHVSLLESLLINGPLLAYHQERVMSMEHLSVVANLIRLKYREHGVMSDVFDLSLDRLAQVLQIGFYNKCIYGNKEDLMRNLDALPEHRLLQIVINNLKNPYMATLADLKPVYQSNMDMCSSSDMPPRRLRIMSSDISR